LSQNRTKWTTSAYLQTETPQLISQRSTQLAQVVTRHTGTGCWSITLVVESIHCFRFRTYRHVIILYPHYRTGAKSGVDIGPLSLLTQRFQGASLGDVLLTLWPLEKITQTVDRLYLTPRSEIDEVVAKETYRCTSLCAQSHHTSPGIARSLNERSPQSVLAESK